MKIAALLLFALLYFLMIVKPKYRPFYALGTAVIFLVSGILPISSLPGVINWNVLMMISGTMIIVVFNIISFALCTKTDVSIHRRYREEYKQQCDNR